MPSASYRCTSPACRVRFTLPKQYGEYVQRPVTQTPQRWARIQDGRCPTCGTGSITYMTPYIRKHSKKVRCRCGGLLAWPHSRGTDGCEFGSWGWMSRGLR